MAIEIMTTAAATPAPSQAGQAAATEREEEPVAAKAAAAGYGLASAETPSTAATTSDEDFASVEQVEEEEEEEEHEKAPPIYGYMYKKSPGAFRIKAWDWRFFVVSNMRIMWWKDRDACIPEVTAKGRTSTEDLESHVRRHAEADPQCRGMVNLLLSGAVVEEDPASETVFYLSPPDGEWAEGATTDKHQDEKRVYVFDVTSSSHSRRAWITAIRRHVEQARQERRRCGDDLVSAAQSEWWEDDTVDEEQMAAAARMLRKLEDRRRPRA